MKNFLKYAEFKKIYENQETPITKLFEKYPIPENKLFEAADDFSNRVGFAESLVGRAINGLFSMFAKNTKKVRLLFLKQKLENEYLAAVLRTCMKHNVAEEQMTSTKDEVFGSSISITEPNEGTIWDVNETTRTDEDYLISIESSVSKPSYKLELYEGDVMKQVIVDKLSLDEYRWKDIPNNLVGEFKIKVSALDNDGNILKGKLVKDGVVSEEESELSAFSSIFEIRNETLDAIVDKVKKQETQKDTQKNQNAIETSVPTFDTIYNLIKKLETSKIDEMGYSMLSNISKQLEELKNKVNEKQKNEILQLIELIKEKVKTITGNAELIKYSEYSDKVQKYTNTKSTEFNSANDYKSLSKVKAELQKAYTNKDEEKFKSVSQSINNITKELKDKGFKEFGDIKITDENGNEMKDGDKILTLRTLFTKVQNTLYSDRFLETLKIPLEEVNKVLVDYYNAIKKVNKNCVGITESFGYKKFLFDESLKEFNDSLYKIYKIFESKEIDKLYSSVDKDGNAEYVILSYPADDDHDLPKDGGGEWKFERDATAEDIKKYGGGDKPQKEKDKKEVFADIKKEESNNVAKKMNDKKDTDKMVVISGVSNVRKAKGTGTGSSVSTVLGDELGKNYADLKLDEIDSEELAKVFKQNPEMVKEATSEVNRQAVALVQLTAERSYGWATAGKSSEFAGKTGGGSYQPNVRQNFTVKPRDKEILAEVWRSYVLKVKAMFKNFLDLDDVDPYRLLNHERKLGDMSYGDPKTSSTPDTKNTPLENQMSFAQSASILAPLLPKLDVVLCQDDNIPLDQYGIINCSPQNAGIEIGVLVRHIIAPTNPKVHLYRYLGLVSWKRFIKNIDELTKMDETQLKKVLLEKYVLGKHNENLFLPEEKKFYSLIHISDTDNDNNISAIYSGQKRLYPIRSNMPIAQLNPRKDNTGGTVYDLYFIYETDKKDIGSKLVSYDDLKKITDKKELSNFNAELHIGSPFYYIKTPKIFNIIDDDATKLDNILINKTQHIIDANNHIFKK